MTNMFIASLLPNGHKGHGIYVEGLLHLCILKVLSNVGLKPSKTSSTGN